MYFKKYYILFLEKKRDFWYFIRYGRSFEKDREKWLEENL